MNMFIPNSTQGHLWKLSTKHKGTQSLGAFVSLGADRENRTPDSSLARTRFTTKPYPLREDNNISAYCLATSLVPPPGLEPGTSVPKTDVISVSLQGHVSHNTYITTILLQS